MTPILVKDVSRIRGLFVAYRDASWSITSGDTLVWDTKAKDVEDWYDPTTGIYTPKIPGLYLFASRAGFTSSTSNRNLWMRLYKNDAAHKTFGLNWCPVGSNSVYTVGSVIAEANGTTDNFRVKGFHNETGAKALFTGEEFAEFSGFLVGAT